MPQYKFSMIAAFFLLFYLLVESSVFDDDPDPQEDLSQYPVTYGSVIKLLHIQSNARLHSHDVMYGLPNSFRRFFYPHHS